MREDLVIQALPMLSEGETFVLGIDGLSRSGKTTFAENLRRKLHRYNDSVIVFHIDDYIVDPSRRYDTGYEEWYEYYHLQWDARSLEKKIFQTFKENAGFILVEGVFLQREEWRSYMDYIVYLDCSREKRFERESSETQQKIEKFKQRYWKAEDYYIDQVNPMKKANLVLKERLC